MAHAETYRRLVVARAGEACEYCRILQAAGGVTFHIEHIVPRSPIGEATVRTLKMNDPPRVFARRLQIAAGLIA